jgi:hypothetical protein
VWYLDDGTIGGTKEKILDDLHLINSEAKSIGLELNMQKCEIFGPNVDTLDIPFEGIRKLQTNELCLLGSALNQESLTGELHKKHEELERLFKKIVILPAHYAFYI